MPDAAPTLIHGTAIAVAGRGLLITGASGSGKSSLAVQLIALGAGLIADDQVALTPSDDGTLLTLRKPHTLPAAIEARGVGLLRAPMIPEAPLVAVLDLGKGQGNAKADQTAPKAVRLPQARTKMIAGVRVKVIENAPSPHFTSAILLYLKHGYQE